PRAGENRSDDVSVGSSERRAFGDACRKDPRLRGAHPRCSPGFVRPGYSVPKPLGWLSPSVTVICGAIFPLPLGGNVSKLFAPGLAMMSTPAVSSMSPGDRSPVAGPVIVAMGATLPPGFGAYTVIESGLTLVT